ncbi:MAG: ABC transporter substrate-binding protein [bacterium]
MFRTVPRSLGTIHPLSFIIAVLGFICFSAVFSDFSSAALPPRFGGEATAGICTKITNFLPALTVEDDEFMVSSSIYEPLVKLGEDGEVVPFLLQKLPVESDDRFIYYFALKDNIYFHNGKKLTAGDVLFTIQEVLKNRRSPYSWIFQDIEGAAEFRKGTKSEISGVKVLDPLRFEIRLKKPEQSFVASLAMPAAFIMAAGVDHRETPVGTGPFKFSEKRASGSIILEANRQYHGGRPYLDRLVFRVIPDLEDALIEYKRGKLDVVEIAPDKVKAIGTSEEGKLLKGLGKRLVFLDENINEPPLDDIGVRKQLFFAIDRDAIVEVILGGEGRVESSLPGLKKVAPKRAAAGKLLQLWYPSDDRTLAFVAERIKYDLFTKMNLQVKLVKRSQGELLVLEKEKEPAFILRTLLYPDTLTGTMDEMFFNSKYSTNFSVLALRMRKSSDVPVGFSAVSVVPLYSYKRNLLVSSKLSGAKISYLNGIIFEEVFRRLL